MQSSRALFQVVHVEPLFEYFAKQLYPFISKSEDETWKEVLKKSMPGSGSQFTVIREDE